MAKGKVEVEIDLDEDFRARIITDSPQDAIEVASALMKEAERARFRGKFFSAAHWVVFAVAGLSIAGMVAHFLNIREFNMTFLVGMGSWTVGTIIYLYFVIIKDVFHLDTQIPKPPKAS